MNIKQFSDKMLAKIDHSKPYEKLGDPIPYNLFENLYHLALSDLEDNGLHTIWYQQNKSHMRSIIKMVIAETLICLAEQNIRSKSTTDRFIIEQTEKSEEARDNLIWLEILKILNYPINL